MPTLKAAGAALDVDPKTATVKAIRLGGGRLDMTSIKPAGLVEVADLRDGRVYEPLKRDFAVRAVKTSSAGGRKAVRFIQQYKHAPFSITHSLSETPAGVRWEVALKLRAGDKSNRSLKVTWVLPLAGGWKFWVPQDTTLRTCDGVTPQHFVYGHTSFRPYGSMIPLMSAWGDKAGLVAFSPPDIQKPYMSFDLSTQAIPASVRGIDMRFGDVPHMSASYHHVGLRPGKTLRLALCLASAQPDWRCALGHYVKSYPELFEVIPETRATEGMYGITTPTRLERGDDLAKLKQAGVTFAEVHGHFPEYSVFVERSGIDNPRLTWNCRPHPTKKPLSVADNRLWIERLKAAGVAPFMYFYNCHALPDTIARRWPGATMRDENRKPLLKWYTEPSVWGGAGSSYRKHVLEQMDLLLEAYPGTVGFFIDNYAIEMYDFAHDDGVTMVHDKPVYDLNRNHQTLGPPCFEKAHKRRKVIMVNKISTIESLRGADMCLAETQGDISIRKHGLACVFRPLFPLAMELPDTPGSAEYGLKTLILNGAFPDDAMYYKDPAATTAYRPLTDAMIGKRWVLEFDPLDVPAGYEGQVFRIDRHAPRGGDVIVALCHPKRAYTDKQFQRGLSVTLRLPEAGKLKRATWLPVERSGRKPAACRMRRKGKSLTVALPPVGAAGILRLSR